MTTKNTGGPAFPGTFYDRDSTGEYQPREQYDGMTLRDYFAAKAMQGMLSLDSTNDYLLKDLEAGHESLAIGSYLVADAMLKEREK